MKTRAHSGSTVGAVLIVAMLLVVSTIANLAFFIRSPEYIYPDSLTYLIPAQHMIHGAGFTDEFGYPDTLRTPGYPLVLAAFLKLGGGIRSVVLAQHVLNIIVTLLLFAMLWRVTDSLAIATIASFLFAIDPTTLRYSNRVLTEPLFTAILLAIFAALLFALEEPRFLRSRTAGIGIACGVLSIVRPAGLYFFLPVALFIAIAWRRRRSQCTAIFVIAALLIPFGWTARNYVRTHFATFSSIGATNLLLYRAAGVLAIEQPGDFVANQTREQNRLLLIAHSQLAREYHTRFPERLPHVIRAERYGEIAKPIVLQHPLSYVELAARGYRHLLLDNDAEAVEMATDYDESIEESVAIYTWAFFVLAIIGLVPLFRRNWRVALLTMLTLAYFLTITAGGEAESRFRTPVVPQYALLAATGVVAMVSSVRNAGKRVVRKS